MRRPAEPRARLFAGLGAATGLALLLDGTVAVFAPHTALAHGLVARTDLPIPRWLFGWAAAVVLLASFVALSVLWPAPKFQRDDWRPLPRGTGRTPGGWLLASGTVGAALLATVIWSGFEGTAAVTDNFSPTFVYVVFWVGLVPASVLLGDVFRAFNPWAAIARGVAWLTVRPVGVSLPPPLRYPPWLGRWPAAVGIGCFAFMELAAGDGAVPQHLAVAAVIYSVLTLTGMSLFGVGPWLDRGEAFSVYFNLFSRISPWQWRAGQVGLRWPLSGLAQLDTTLPGTVPLIAVMIGSVTFDGVSEGPLWTPLAQTLVSFFTAHGVSGLGAARLAAAAGLGASIVFVYGLYLLGIAGVRRIGGALPSTDLAGSFVHALVPIAVAYVGAHYLTFLLTQGQAIIALASDPLGRGWNLFGTADQVVNYGIIGVTTSWYLQVALVLAGHVAGLTAAHDRALVLYRDRRLAWRSQYCMLAVMVSFTLLALYILAQANL